MGLRNGHSGLQKPWCLVLQPPSKVRHQAIPPKSPGPLTQASDHLDSSFSRSPAGASSAGD